jgi:hypothetical protein
MPSIVAGFFAKLSCFNTKEFWRERLSQEEEAQRK